MWTLRTKTASQKETSIIEEVSLMRKGHLEVTEFDDKCWRKFLTMFAQNSVVDG